MKMFNPDNLWVIRPMTLIQLNEHIKLNIPMEVLKQLKLTENYEPVKILKQGYLALKNDTTFALDNGKTFTCIFTGESFPKYIENNEIAGNDYIIHPKFSIKLSELLFEKRSNNCELNLKNALNKGIYASIITSYDNIAKDILSEEYNEKELNQLLNGVKKESKNKLIYVERQISGGKTKTKVYEKNFGK